MNVRESAQAQLTPRAADPLDRLAHWATARPRGLALIHKRRGQWKGWRWDDVHREVSHLRDALLAPRMNSRHGLPRRPGPT